MVLFWQWDSSAVDSAKKISKQTNKLLHTDPDGPANTHTHTNKRTHTHTRANQHIRTHTRTPTHKTQQCNCVIGVCLFPFMIHRVCINSFPHDHKYLSAYSINSLKNALSTRHCNTPQDTATHCNTPSRRMTTNVWVMNVAIMHSEDTPTNKVCRRAPRAAHERDQITNEIVQSRYGFFGFFFGIPTFFL